MTAQIFFDEVHRRYRRPAAFILELRSRMRLHGITQGQLARRSGFSPSHITRWLGENRSVVPSLETMIILDEAMEQLIHRG